jgi:hypothetical protein
LHRPDGMGWKLLTDSAMRNSILLLIVAASLIWSSNGFCDESEGSPMVDPLPPPMQDPSLSTSRYFPPSLTTSGVAQIGPARGSVNGHSHGCGAPNSCALPPPDLDRAVTARAS